jgi:phosphotransferase system HPr (HPr) family protein
MPDVTLTIRNPSGLHARPAALFVRSAAAFASDVRITNLSRDPDKAAPAGSLLAVLALGVSRGHEIRISAEGDDADEALASLTELVEGGLGEPIEGEE